MDGALVRAWLWLTASVMVGSGACAQPSTGTITTYADRSPTGGATFGAGETATVRSSGTRSGVLGRIFLTIEGRNNGSFASWGAVRFDLSQAYAAIDAQAIADGFDAGVWRITSAYLSLTQDNDDVSESGGPLEIYLVPNDSRPINPLDSVGDAAFGIGGALGGGRMYNGALGQAFGPVGSVSYVVGPDGTMEGADISGVIGRGAELSVQDRFLTLVIDTPSADVVATYRGQDSPFEGWNAPALTLEYITGSVEEIFTGACCTFPACVDDVLPQDCVESFEMFFSEQLCSQVNCPTPTGACCAGPLQCQDGVGVDSCLPPAEFLFNERCVDVDCPGSLATFADAAGGSTHLETRGAGHAATIRGYSDDRDYPPGVVAPPEGTTRLAVRGLGTGGQPSLGALKFFLRSGAGGATPPGQPYLYDALDAIAVQQDMDAGDWLITAARLELIIAEPISGGAGGEIEVLFSDQDLVDINPQSAEGEHGWEPSLVGPGDLMFEGYETIGPFGSSAVSVAIASAGAGLAGDRVVSSLIVDGPALVDLNEQTDSTLLLLLDTTDASLDAVFGGQNPVGEAAAARLVVEYEIRENQMTIGACCELSSCQDPIMAGECNGVFIQDASCVNVDCMDVGACCTATACEELIPIDACDGTYRSGEGCDIVTCCPTELTACCDPSFGCVQGDDRPTCITFGGTYYRRGDCNVDADGSGEADLCEGISPCPFDMQAREGDANGDGMVTIADVLFVIARFGGQAGTEGDVNGDDLVTIADVLFVIARFGTN